MFYRFRQSIQHARFRHATRILSSPPVPCNPYARCTVHTMLSAKDLPLYLAAIKSFLRFDPDLAVTVYSDGTLGRWEDETLRQHVPGCQVISAAAADARADKELGRGSFLYQCRAWDASYRRVIDTELWNATPKRIIMDSDILILRRPTEVIEWLEGGSAPFLLGQPAEPPPPPAGAKKFVQAVFREHVPSLAQRLGLPDRFPQGATGGFYGLGREELSFGQLERIIKASLALGIPMHEWGGEQCIVIYLLASAGATRLHPDLYLNFDTNQVEKIGTAHVVHFLGSCRFFRDVYINSAAQIVQGLRSPAEVAA